MTRRTLIAVAAVALAAITMAPLDGAAQPSVAGLQAAWGFGTLGSGVGVGGIVVAQNGGAQEIYVGGLGTSFAIGTSWQALVYSPSTRRYDAVFVSDYYPAWITRIAVVRLPGFTAPLIVVALRNGTVHLYDQRTKYSFGTFQDPCTYYGGLQAFTTADLNADGADEFLSLCATGTLIVYGADYDYWLLDGAPAATAVPALAVGQMDDDAALEIATAAGKVIDAATRSVQWHWTDGFGAPLVTSDVDGDGRAELLGAKLNTVWSYDVEQRLPGWSVEAFDVDAIHVADIDADGVKELLVGDGQWGEIHAFSTATRFEEWAIDNPDHGVADIAVADVDSDGALEIVWAAGHSSTGEDHLYVADWTRRQIEWQNEHFDGPFIGPAIADLDGDGHPEIVAVTFSSGSFYDSGRIVVVDSRTLTVRAISAPVVGGRSYLGVRDLELRDLNGDNRPEILIATNRSTDGVIEAYSFSASNVFTVVWTNAVRPYGEQFWSVDAADVDGDGQMEIIGGTHSHTGQAFLRVYDYATRAEEWSIAVSATTTGISELALSDLDGDGKPEIAALIEGGGVFVIDGETHENEATIDGTATALSVVNAGIPLLLTGDSQGNVTVHTVAAGVYTEVASVRMAATTIDGVHLTSDGAFWIASGGVLTRYLNGGVLRTANYGPWFGRTLATLGGNVVFSGGGQGVHAFVIAP